MFGINSVVSKLEPHLIRPSHFIQGPMSGLRSYFESRLESRRAPPPLPLSPFIDSFVSLMSRYHPQRAFTTTADSNQVWMRMIRHPPSACSQNILCEA